MRVETRDLGWHPAYDLRTVLRRLADGQDHRSPLAVEVGASINAGDPIAKIE